MVFLEIPTFAEVPLAFCSIVDDYVAATTSRCKIRDCTIHSMGIVFMNDRSCPIFPSETVGPGEEVKAFRTISR